MAHRSPIVIAEIGCNHKGDFEIAKEMVRIAKVFCNADAVKFQKRNTRELLTAEEYNAPHPNPVHSYGETYGKHREFLGFDFGSRNCFAPSQVSQNPFRLQFEFRAIRLFVRKFSR